MATEPLTNEEIALTEKKVDMCLDDIIKMSKEDGNKSKKQRRPPNKNQSLSNGATKYNALRTQRYMDSRSSFRQGAFAKRRSNFQGNQFHDTSYNARKPSIAPPLRSRHIDAGRIFNTNQSRFLASPVQNKAGHGGFVAKQKQRRENEEQKEGNGWGRQRPRTLDSLFANMKEERMRSVSNQQHLQQQNSNVWGGAIVEQQQQQHRRRWVPLGRSKR